MRILVLILARSGSKRLPKKNLKILGKIPLIQWTIDFAKLIDSESIMLSTDDRSISEIGLKNNILVPWIRPRELSGDKATSACAAIHAINWYEKNYHKIDGIILLQPTSPFRNLKEIKKGIMDFKKNKDPIIAVYHNKKAKSGFIIKNKIAKKLKRISNGFQTKNKIYTPTGSFYIIKPKDLREYRSFYNLRAKPLIISKRKYQIDIDTINDFNEAKEWLNSE